MGKKRDFRKIIQEWNRSVDFDDFCRRLQVDKPHGIQIANSAKGRGIFMKSMSMADQTTMQGVITFGNGKLRFDS